MLFKTIYNLGDKTEDRVRGFLSHYPIVYAFIGGAGIIIFWRGIWNTMDFVMERYFLSTSAVNNIGGQLLWWDGPFSIILGATLLLITGLFVSSFIGSEIIISGLKGEKRVAEKTVEEIKEDTTIDVRTLNELKEISRRLEKLETK